jgi:hypothetical protein
VPTVRLSMYQSDPALTMLKTAAKGCPVLPLNNGGPYIVAVTLEGLE